MSFAFSYLMFLNNNVSQQEIKIDPVYFPNTQHLTCISIWSSVHYSSLHNENSVINYLLLCRSKHIRPSFIFTTQIKIFFYEIRELSDPA